MANEGRWRVTTIFSCFCFRTGSSSDGCLWSYRLISLCSLSISILSHQEPFPFPFQETKVGTRFKSNVGDIKVSVFFRSALYLSFIHFILSAAKGHEGRQPGQIKSHVWPIRVVEEWRHSFHVCVSVQALPSSEGCLLKQWVWELTWQL